MKHVVTVAFVLAAASCGGKSSTRVGNAGGGGGTAPAAVALSSGIHGCHFVIDNDAFATHRCDVSGAELEKVSGMETFRGQLAPMGTGLHLTAEMGCGPMVDRCNQPFEVHLEKVDGAWQGKVEAKSAGQAEGEWWLSGATLVVDDSNEYGGLHYGGGAD